MYTTCFNKDDTFFFLDDQKNIVQLPMIQHPHTHFLFHNDVFHYDDKQNKCHIIHSPYRESILPCVMILSDNKTYGRSKINNKLLFK